MQSHLLLDSEELLVKLIKTRVEADIAWEEAGLLEPDEECDDAEIDKYSIANQKYAECHILVNQYIMENEGIEALLIDHTLLHRKQYNGLTVATELYFAIKTIADSYFSQGEFFKAHPLYTLAARMLRICLKHTETKIWMNNMIGDMPIIYSNLKSNAGLCALYHYENGLDSDEEILPKEVIDQCIDDFVSRLYNLRLSNDDNVNAYEIAAASEIILRARVLLNNRAITFPSPREMDRLRWCIQEILSSKQIKALIALPLIVNPNNLIHLLSHDSLAINEHQRRKANALATDQKTPIEGYANWFADRLAAYQQSNAYQTLGLKNHQKIAFDSIQKHFAIGQHQAGIDMATGTGKTRTFISLLLSIYHELPRSLFKKNKSMIVVPQLSLSDQTLKRIEELLKLSNINIRVSQFNGKVKNEGDITIISLQSLISEMGKNPEHRVLKLNDYRIFVFDEIHKALTKKCKELIFELKKNSIIIACTATPKYDIQRPIGSLSSMDELLGSENCIVRYPLQQAINDKVLAPLRIFLVKGITQVPHRGKKKKEYNLKKFNAVYAKDNYNEINATTLELYLNLHHPDTGVPLRGKKAFAFCLGIRHAAILAEDFANHGVKAAVISGESSAIEQAALLKAFCEGEIDVLCGADILNTGIDVPVEILFNLRPTKSNVLGEQRLGRVTRPAKDKRCGIVFEMVMVKDQILATQFIGNKQVAGDLPPLQEAAKKMTRNTLRQEEKIPGACEWEVYAQAQESKSVEYLPLNIPFHSAFVHPPLLQPGIPTREIPPHVPITGISSGFGFFSPVVASKKRSIENSQYTNDDSTPQAKRPRLNSDSFMQYNQVENLEVLKQDDVNDKPAATENGMIIEPTVIERHEESNQNIIPAPLFDTPHSIFNYIDLNDINIPDSDDLFDFCDDNTATNMRLPF